jgi:hypothetical protein
LLGSRGTWVLIALLLHLLVSLQVQGKQVTSTVVVVMVVVVEEVAVVVTLCFHSPTTLKAAGAS